MFRSRRSYKVAPGIRLNTGKRGVTSVNVAGVKLGSASRSGGGRGPTKAERQARVWRIKPGLWYARVLLGGDDDLNLEIRGSELTLDRFTKMAQAVDEKNPTAEARIFRRFVASWDMAKEDGKGIEPISVGTLRKLGSGFFFGISVEIANALEIPTEPLNSIIRDSDTRERPQVLVSNRPLPAHQRSFATSTESGVVILSNDLATKPRKKQGGCASSAGAFAFLFAVLALASKTISGDGSRRG